MQAIVQDEGNASNATWMLNLGVCHHLIFDVTQVPNFNPYLGIEGIIVGDGNKIFISNVGFGVL